MIADKSDHFAMAYKFYLRDLFDEVLVFLDGVLIMHSITCSYLQVLLYLGSSWQGARGLLEAAFSHESVVCSLGQIKR